ncbi:MAG: 2-amino-4-hydroxy-6-hydroxymethyldihydropteridine diphosphokinase [Kiloniellaceae bacterium]
MIFIGLGANLPSPRYGDPVNTCAAALVALQEAGVAVARRSRWYRSAPVPRSDQPWFVNGVAQVETGLGPGELLAVLHGVERAFGRVRRLRNEARMIDLDLLAYGLQVSTPGQTPVLPHPRLAERAFVVLPLAELAPQWRHPLSGLSAAELALRLPPDQAAEPIE